MLWLSDKPITYNGEFTHSFFRGTDNSKFDGIVLGNFGQFQWSVHGSELYVLYGYDFIWKSGHYNIY